MKVRTGRLIARYNGAFHSSSGQTPLLLPAEPRKCRLPLAAEPLFQTTSSAPSLPVWLPLRLCCFWTTPTSEEGKASSLRLLRSPPVRVRFPCAFGPHTFNFMQMKKMSRRDHLAEPCPVRGKKSPPPNPSSASMRRSVPLAYRRHYAGMHGAAPPAPPRSCSTQGSLRRVSSFHRCQRVRTRRCSTFSSGRAQPGGKDLV